MTNPSPRLHWSKEHGGHWVATSHELCCAVAADPAAFSSASSVHVPPSGLYERGIKIFALEYDEPTHWEHRQILRDAVGDRPSTVPEALIRTCLDARMDLLDWSAPVDLVAGLADPLPLDVIFALMGADEEFKPEMKALTDALLHRRPAPGVDDPAARVHEIAETMVLRRVASAQDDWITTLVDQQVAGERLTVGERVAAVVSLITGGHHSTSRGLGSLLARLVTEAGLRDRLLAEPELVPAAVDETLRLHTPLPDFSRTATCPVELKGEVIAAGEAVNLRYAEANRDPAVFPDPEAFRLDRRRAQHLAFGYGPHRCIGVHLARAQLSLALAEVLRRAPDVEVVGAVTWRGPAQPVQVLVRSVAAQNY